MSTWRSVVVARRVTSSWLGKLGPKFHRRDVIGGVSNQLSKSKRETREGLHHRFIGAHVFEAQNLGKLS